MADSKNKKYELRHERKFVCENLNLEEATLTLLLNPGLFTEAYSTRFVNNIYFDSQNLLNYQDAVNGSPNRLKYRIRWYGDLLGRKTDSRLEVKYKEGQVIKKIFYKLPPFTLGKQIKKDVFFDLFKKAKLPAFLKEELIHMQPVVINRYIRKYYKCTIPGVRATVDFDQQYFQADLKHDIFLKSPLFWDSIIIELKYSPELEDKVDFIANKFPFRLSKNSKYVLGTQIVNHNIN